MFKTLLIKYIAGNLDKLIAFLQDLDKQIDAFVDAETKKQTELADEQNRLAKEQAASEAKTATALNLKGGLQGLTQTSLNTDQAVLRA